MDIAEIKRKYLLAVLKEKYYIATWILLRLKEICIYRRPVNNILFHVLEI